MTWFCGKARVGLTGVIIPHIRQVISPAVVRFANWKGIRIGWWGKRWLIRTGSGVMGQIHVAIVAVVFLGTVKSVELRGESTYVLALGILVGLWAPV